MYRSLSVLFLGFMLSGTSFAGISLDSTRLVFSEGKAQQGQSIGVTSSKKSEVPYLVKAQLLTSPDGESAGTPFVVSPSLFRLEPGMTNQLRIMQTRSGLPRNKESVFYLRVVAMPAGDNSTQEPSQTLGGALIVSTASVIKVFYRPAGLAESQQQAMKSLQFSRQGQHFKVYNPSPYFITLASMTVGDSKVPLSVKQQNTMLAPFSSQTYAVKFASGSVKWKAINDFGGVEEFQGEVQ